LSNVPDSKEWGVAGRVGKFGKKGSYNKLGYLPNVMEVQFKAEV
jgi:hypothetical protein